MFSDNPHPISVIELSILPVSSGIAVPRAKMISMSLNLEWVEESIVNLLGIIAHDDRALIARCFCERSFSGNRSMGWIVSKRSHIPQTRCIRKVGLQLMPDSH